MKSAIRTPRTSSRLFECYFVLCLLFICVLSGCGTAGTATVTGTIKLDGEPLAAGNVLFESEGVICVGTIQDGKFSMRYGDGNAIPVADYRVSICPPSIETRIDAATTRVQAVGKVDYQLYPKKYRSPSTSDLSFSPQPGHNEFLIEITR